MASVEELKDALRENLDSNGTMRKLKAKIRGEIFAALRDTEAAPAPQELSNENLVINELIREYMIFNGYRETLSVFLPETGQPLSRPFERSFLAEHLNLIEGPNSKQLPLLYNLVASAQAPLKPSRRLKDDNLNGGKPPADSHE
eukprot:gene5240-18471_t